MVNGLPVAVCWEAAQENMVIDPLPNFPIVRDLVVDRTGYDRVVSSFRRYLAREEKPSKFPEDLRHEDMLKVWYSIQCVECLCCTAVCPVSEVGYKPWVGPMGHVQLAKYALDPRDSLDRTEELLAAGATKCVGCYACVDICPAEIRPMELFLNAEKQLLAAAGKGDEATHISQFESMVKEDGMISPVKLFFKEKGLAALLKVPLALKMGLRGKMPKFEKQVPGMEEIRNLIVHMEERDA